MAIRSLPVLLLAVALMACSTLPRPFRPPSDDPANPLVSISPDNAGIVIEPIDGPPVPMARLIADSAAQQLNRRGIPASAGQSTGGKRYVLRGVSAPNMDPSDSSIVLIRWVLFDGAGRPVGRHVQEVHGTWAEWEYGDPRIIEAVGEGIAPPVAAMIQGGDPNGTVVATRAGLWVKGVSGAPGDGNVSLARAMQLSLKTVGVATAGSPESARFYLEGAVEMELVAPGTEKIRIVWTVVDGEGAVMGRASQENAIPAGSLKGPWGETAGLAAEAAVDGIEDILDRVRSREARIGTPARALSRPPAAVPEPDPGPSQLPGRPAKKPLPALPPPTALPQIPGRAMPPP